MLQALSPTLLILSTIWLHVLSVMVWNGLRILPQVLLNLLLLKFYMHLLFRFVVVLRMLLTTVTLRLFVVSLRFPILRLRMRVSHLANNRKFNRKGKRQPRGKNKTPQNEFTGGPRF